MMFLHLHYLSKTLRMAFKASWRSVQQDDDDWVTPVMPAPVKTTMRDIHRDKDDGWKTQPTKTKPTQRTEAPVHRTDEPSKKQNDYKDVAGFKKRITKFETQVKESLKKGVIVEDLIALHNEFKKAK